MYNLVTDGRLKSTEFGGLRFHVGLFVERVGIPHYSDFFISSIHAGIF